ncbi:MAG: hypothetical protein OXF02_07045 [Simkaniaceae bacterium]|nr:hypothetical protein [Simkaniaceae bacterium]
MSVKARFLGNFDKGLTKNAPSWLIDEGAFSHLTNAYVWRGTVRKRFGTEYVGSGTIHDARLSLKLRAGGSSDPLTIPSDIKPAPGQVLSYKPPSDPVVYLIIPSVPATGTVTLLSNREGVSATLDVATKTFTITPAPTVDVWLFPCLPVMGFALREGSRQGLYETIAFDTRRSYRRISSKQWVDIGGGKWTGRDTNHFSHVNFRFGNSPPLLFVTNGVRVNTEGSMREADWSGGIAYLNRENPPVWSVIAPVLAQATQGATEVRLLGALLLFSFRNALFAAGTIEGDPALPDNDRVYPGKLVWSTPFESPIDDASRQQDHRYNWATGFNQITLSTSEKIVSVAPFRDRLIVFMERSTFEIVPTGIAEKPFKSQKISSNRGSVATFGTVPLEEGVVTVGSRGIHICDGTRVDRVDSAIPDEIFRLNLSSTSRIHAIRNFYRELVYFTLPLETSTSRFVSAPFARDILVWNRENGSFAYTTEPATSLGRFLREEDNTTWSELGDKVGTWNKWTGTWRGTSVSPQKERVCFGTRQGVVLTIEEDSPVSRNTLLVANVTGYDLTVPSHQFVPSNRIRLRDPSYEEIDDRVYTVVAVSGDTVSLLPKATPFYDTARPYKGTATVGLVSEIRIEGADWNPLMQEGYSLRIPYLDFSVKQTPFGEFSVRYFINGSPFPVNDSGVAGVYGDSVVSTAPEPGDDKTASPFAGPPQEQEGRYLRRRFFMNGRGQTIRVRLFLNDEQLENTGIIDSDLAIGGITVYFQGGGRITR